MLLEYFGVADTVGYLGNLICVCSLGCCVNEIDNEIFSTLGM